MQINLQFFFEMKKRLKNFNDQIDVEKIQIVARMTSLDFHVNCFFVVFIQITWYILSVDHSNIGVFCLL